MSDESRADQLRVIAERLASGIIPRGAAHDVELGGDEIDRLTRERDALVRHADEQDAEIASLKAQLAPPFDATALLDFDAPEIPEKFLRSAGSVGDSDTTGESN